jgi:hypothetical protein
MSALPLQDTNDYIRQQAYYSWEADGCPNGRDLEYWERARVEHYATITIESVLLSANGRYEGGTSAQPPVL